MACTVAYPPTPGTLPGGLPRRSSAGTTVGAQAPPGWNETRQFLEVEITTISTSSTSKTEGITKDAPGISTTWATTVAGHVAGSTMGRSGVGMPTELGHLSARLQSFLEPILHPQGRWVQVSGDWIWKDAKMRQWNLGSALFVEHLFSKYRHI